MIGFTVLENSRLFIHYTPQCISTAIGGAPIFKIKKNLMTISIPMSKENRIHEKFAQRQSFYS